MTCRRHRGRREPLGQSSRNIACRSGSWRMSTRLGNVPPRGASHIASLKFLSRIACLGGVRQNCICNYVVSSVVSHVLDHMTDPPVSAFLSRTVGVETVGEHHGAPSRYSQSYPKFPIGDAHRRAGMRNRLEDSNKKIPTSTFPPCRLLSTLTLNMA